MSNINEGKVEIDLEEMGKITITMRKMAPEELEESRKESQAEQELISKTEESGEWWRLWERKEIEEYFSHMGCRETVRIAVKELKKVFTAEWFRLQSNGHSLRPPLTMPNGLHSLGYVVPLGSAINILGSKALTANIINDLRSKENFYHRAYELEVLAFLKIVERSPILLEHELPLPKDAKKPDAKVGEVYVEIKDLSFSKREISAYEMLKEITNFLWKKFKDYKGCVAYVIDLGGPKSLEELDEAIKITKCLIDSIDVKESGAKILSRNNIKVKLKLIERNIKGCFGTITNYGRPELVEIHRMFRKLLESTSKNPGDAPMIVVIRPSIPMIVLAEEKLRELLEVELFKLAIRCEVKVKKVKELWIDVTMVDAEMLKKMFSSPITSLLRVFIKLRNPFFNSH
ncbi:MAG: hypothetical protein QXE04_01545 [Thermoplasmatales archaeon]